MVPLQANHLASEWKIQFAISQYMQVSRLPTWSNTRLHLKSTGRHSSKTHTQSA